MVLIVLAAIPIVAERAAKAAKYRQRAIETTFDIVARRLVVSAQPGGANQARPSGRGWRVVRLSATIESSRRSMPRVATTRACVSPSSVAAQRRIPSLPLASPRPRETNLWIRRRGRRLCGNRS
jgi:hypothetical protein